MVERALRIGWHSAAVVLLACCGCGAGERRAAHGEPRQDAAAGHEAAPDAGELATDGATHALDGGDAAANDAGRADAAAADAGRADAATADHEPPQLVASTPSDGDDNVAADGTPMLVFSEPVVLGAGALQLRQATPSRALAFTTAQSADGLSIEVTLDQAPELPAELTLQLGAGITDLAGNRLEPIAVHFTVPAWLRLGAAQNRKPLASATDVRLTLDHQGRPVMLDVEHDDVYASRWENGGWQALGAALNQQATLASPGAEPRIALAVDASGAPIAAFRETAGVIVVRWDGAAWQGLGDAADPNGGGSYAPALALGAAGEPIVAFDGLDTSAQPVLRVRALEGASWQTLADIGAQARGVRLSGDGQSDFTLAYQEIGTGIVVSRWDGAALVPLGVGGALAAVSGSFAMSVASAQSCALTAPGQGTVRWALGAWSAVPQDLGFVNSSAALDRTLAYAPDAALLSAFSETPPGEGASRVYAQRLEGNRFQPLGPPLNRDRQALAIRPALVPAATGQPLVAWLETPASGGPAQIFVSRFNSDPAQPPHGLRERAYNAHCLATAPLDGSLLTATGCFADALGRQPVAGFIPFDVRSPLWSDGAFKRRFLMLPKGTTITYRDPGIWTLPAGSILIKEFSIEGQRGDPSTLRPVETRLLVVRDTGNWDRYSYQWDQAASQAMLRPTSPASSTSDFDIQDELGAPSVQTHFFPNRGQCLGCHETPGTVLGLQTAMINRNFDYGITVDNQLRSMQQLGILGSSFAPDTLELARFMPNPSDTTYPTEARLRAYLHANCSSCHHPLESMDLRIQVDTLSSGLCTKITKGDLNASVIYWRDVLRGYIGQPGNAPMPPLGTLEANPLLETILTDWILDPQNPCP